jgi:hypothetical protein
MAPKKWPMPLPLLGEFLLEGPGLAFSTDGSLM